MDLFSSSRWRTRILASRRVTRHRQIPVIAGADYASRSASRVRDFTSSFPICAFSRPAHPAY
jgi:hypothetical protein